MTLPFSGLSGIKNLRLPKPKPILPRQGNVEQKRWYEITFLTMPSMKNTEQVLNTRLSLGTKTLTETRESLDQDPDSFFQPKSRPPVENIPDTNPRCFIQLFQEGVALPSPLATTPMKTSTATREAMDQEEALSAMITRTMTRTREESDQDDGAMSYHAIPRF